MSHLVRPAALTTDCRTGDLAAAVAFRPAVFSGEAGVKPDGKYAVFREGRPRAVGRGPWAHVDFEAEAARLSRPGARAEERLKGRILVAAPTGSRLRLDPAGTDFPADAREFD